MPIGRRKEIDNVMKKARANTNDYWDKKLLEVEEKDPNRWRHTGYKKMYIEGESSSDSDRDSFRYNRVWGIYDWNYRIWNKNKKKILKWLMVLTILLSGIIKSKSEQPKSISN